MRLIRIVEIVGDIGQSFEPVGLYQSYRFLESHDPDVVMWRETNRTEEPPLELTFRYMQTLQQLRNSYRLDPLMNQPETPCAVVGANAERPFWC